ncbi:MAG TPA: glycosyltransferase family 2 protein [Chitinispirillaceae bacterium]|nr:glycosyltransferase family 2 protein [Chitinispirillaceae bacterium]
MSFEQFLGTSSFTRVLFIIAAAFAVGDIFATLFTVVYQRFWYDRVMRPKYGDNSKQRCSIIIPCKGLPKDLENNLKGFFELDHSNYEVVFVTESETDPAVAVIRSIMRGKSNVKLAIAGLAKFCAQKNHNLLAALKLVDNPDILVFADSDIRPEPHWLRELILPLASPKITATSGFRWLHAKKGTTGELTHSYVNAFMYVLFSVACFVGGVGLWGGSMAIRRKDFDELGVAEKWASAAVDDMSLSQIVMKNRKKAVVVPPCIVHTDDLIETVKSSVSWFERQIMYLKAYQPLLWLVAFPFALTGVGLVVLLPFSILASISEHRSFLGMGGGAAVVFYVGEFLTAMLYVLLGTMHRLPKFLLLQPFLRVTQGVSYFKTLLTNTITWAGIKYNINFHGEVVSIRRPDCDE